MATIHGHCDDRFSAVRDVIAENLDNGNDVGSSACVILDGEVVVDIWGGDITDVDGNEGQWAEDTLINVYSTTKTMCNLSALICADRGLIDLNAPVATYWPEFKANGKENVLVRHLLGHTSGLSGFEEPLAAEDLYNWDLVCERLAAQAPWWEPGTASGYHAITQGYLVGEVVHRVTGKSLGTFFKEEIAEPLGADFHIGAPASTDARTARLIPMDTPPAVAQAEAAGDAKSVLAKTFMNPIVDPTMSWTEGWRRAEIPAANGQGNARSVAQVQSIVSHGGTRNGTRFISEEGIERIFEVQMEGKPDLVLGLPITLGNGYGLISEAMPLAPTKKACFWGGYGGSLVVNDLENKMTVAFVMNKMGGTTTGDARGIGVVWAAFAGLNN